VGKYGSCRITHRQIAADCSDKSYFPTDQVFGWQVFPMAVIPPQARGIAAAIQGVPIHRPAFQQRVNELVIVIGRWRDAQSLGAARDGRIVDRLDVDAVLGAQEIARFLALLRIRSRWGA
jgi:hypothetical protein